MRLRSARVRPDNLGDLGYGGLVRAGVLALFAVLAIATLVSVWREPGWPFGHDGRAFAQRTYIYARHWSQFDLLPIWSSTDASGFGSPMPLMYHKLFYFLAALLALATGSIKIADATAVAVMLTVGAAGLYATMRAIGASRLAATVAGCCLVTANYTVTDWLVRGALAESSGAMVITWAFYFFVRTIQAGRLGVGFGLTLGVLWLGHTVLAYYAGWILGITYLSLALVRVAPWSILDPRTAWRSALCFVLVLAPYLLSMAIVGRGYDFARILTPPLRPADQFVPLGRYFWDTGWRFGRTAAGLTVQLDLPMVALLATGVVVLLVRGWTDPSVERHRILRTAMPFLIVMGIGMLLQLPAALFVYERLPGAAYVQFPWRLLALITPTLIVAAVYIADQALPTAARLFGLGAAAAWTVAGSGAFVPLLDSRLPLDAPPFREHVSFSGFREYEPRTAPALAETMARMNARWAQRGCSYERLDPRDEEVLVVTLHTVCGQAQTLPLPLYASSLHVVEGSTYKRGQRCLSLPDFPAVCGAVVPAADGFVSVKLPTMAAIPKWAWQALRYPAH